MMNQNFQQPMYQQPMYNNMYNTAPSYVGFNYGQKPLPKGTNPVTKAEAAKIRQEVGALSLAPTETELIQSKCTHRDQETGVDRSVLTADGQVYCPICDDTFRNVSGLTKDDVQETVDNMVGILQLIKMAYLDIPEEVCTQYMAIIPLLKKSVPLFEIANNHFTKYEGNNGINPNGSNNLFNRYNYAVGNAVPMGVMQTNVPQQQFDAYGNPVYAQQQMMGQPMYQQQASFVQPGVQGMVPNSPFYNTGVTATQQQDVTMNPNPQQVQAQQQVQQQQAQTQQPPVTNPDTVEVVKSFNV